jgi:hypothetical protein
VFGRSANAVDLDTYGAEAVIRRSWTYCTLVLGGTLLTKSAQYFGPSEVASFYALNYARERLTAAISLHLAAGLDLRWDNEIRNQEPDLLRSQGGNEAYHASVGLIWRPAAFYGAELTLQADNLTNSAYQAVPGVPASPRQYTLGVAKAW